MKEQYLNESQQRLLKVVKALAGHELEGLTPGELRQRVGCSPANITRDVNNLLYDGWIEKVPNAPERVRLGPRIVQMAMAHTQHIQNMQNRINEMSERYSRAS